MAKKKTYNVFKLVVQSELINVCPGDNFFCTFGKLLVPTVPGKFNGHEVLLVNSRRQLIIFKVPESAQLRYGRRLALLGSLARSMVVDWQMVRLALGTL